MILIKKPPRSQRSPNPPLYSQHPLTYFRDQELYFFVHFLKKSLQTFTSFKLPSCFSLTITDYQSHPLKTPQTPLKLIKVAAHSSFLIFSTFRSVTTNTYIDPHTIATQNLFMDFRSLSKSSAHSLSLKYSVTID